MKKQKVPAEVLNSLIGMIMLYHEDTGQLPDAETYADLVRYALLSTCVEEKRA